MHHHYSAADSSIDACSVLSYHAESPRPITADPAMMVASPSSALPATQNITRCAARTSVSSDADSGVVVVRQHQEGSVDAEREGCKGSPQPSFIRGPISVRFDGGSSQCLASPNQTVEDRCCCTTEMPLPPVLTPEAKPSPPPSLFVSLSRRLLRVLVLDLFDDDDSFELLIRKGSICFMGVAGFLCLFFAAFYAWLSTYVQPGTYGGQVHMAVIMFSYAICCGLPCYAYLYVTHRAPNAVANWLFLGALCLAITASSGSHLFPAMSCVIVISSTVISAGVPNWDALTVMLGAIGLVFIAATLAWPAMFMITLHKASELETFFLSLSAFVPFVVAVSQAVATRLLASRALRMTQGAQQLSRGVAAALNEYDTAAVRLQLTDYEASGAVDKQLLESFTQLCHNLERYRAHLPNYVLDDKTGQTHENDIVRSRDSETESRLRTYASRMDHSGNNPTRRNSLHAESDSAPRDAARHPNSVDGSAHDSREGLGLAGERPTSGRGATQEALLSSPRASAASLVLSGPGGHARVTLAHVALRTIRDSSLAMNDLVCEVAAMAARTQAALHCFVGDTVLVSWNATRRVEHAEAKAVRFVDAVRHYTEHDGSDDFNFAGAAVATGGARTQFAGDRATQHFTLSMAWRRPFSDIVRLAERHSALLVDNATREAAQYEYRLVAIGALPKNAYEAMPHANVDPERRLLYQVLGAARRAGRRVDVLHGGASLAPGHNGANCNPGPGAGQHRPCSGGAAPDRRSR